MKDEQLHLASGEQAAENIKRAFGTVDRLEPVLHPEDSFCEGPLVDVDSGGAARRDWYRRIKATIPEADLPLLDDSTLWERVRGASGRVVLWHGPSAIDRIFALRACWHLREQPERVHEVAVAPSGTLRKSGERRPTFYDGIALLGPKALIPAWDRCARVTDVAARAERWTELRDEPGDWIRILEGDAIVELPVDAFDAALVAASARKGTDWTTSRLVIATVIAENLLGLNLMRWRLRELIGAGALEARGDDAELGLPGEVRIPAGA